LHGGTIWEERLHQAEICLPSEPKVSLAVGILKGGYEKQCAVLLRVYVILGGGEKEVRRRSMGGNTRSALSGKELPAGKCIVLQAGCQTGPTVIEAVAGGEGPGKEKG